MIDRCLELEQERDTLKAEVARLNEALDSALKESRQQALEIASMYSQLHGLCDCNTCEACIDRHREDD